jgi:tRNA U34 2-thiouridine synthase MnmA/TrmU
MNKSAVALISGGVDSILAAKLAKDAGIEIHGLYMKSAFFGSSDIKKIEYVYKSAEVTGIPLTIFDCDKEFMDILRHPKRGYGKNMNPCIDCHAFFVRKAFEFCPALRASFVVTGEVLGQRPMSQNEKSLYLVEKDAGGIGRILRPLSAKLLPPTQMEKAGIINRDDFLDIRGRSRVMQLELVKKYNLDINTSSAGGCYLTDKGFSKKVIDYIKHYQGYNIDHISLMPYGRHLRISDNAKLIVGRDEVENEIIERHGSLGVLLSADEYTAGPTCVLIGEYDKSDLQTAVMIVNFYSDGKGEKEIIVREKGIETRMLCDEINKDEINSYRIIT